MNEMIFHAICSDKKGVIARFTQIFYKSGANILALEQHVDPEDGYFFMRIHADLSSIVVSDIDLKNELQQLSDKINANIKIYNPLEKINVAIFCTHESQPVVDLLMKQQSGELECNLPIVISNHNDLKKLVNSFGVKYCYLPIGNNGNHAQEKLILNKLKENNIDLIVLARYMQVLSAKFLKSFDSDIINIHHGFLPAFKGGNPYRQAWERGVKMIGATAHYVTHELDEGPIISQDTELVTHQFSINEMIESGRDIERRVLFEAVKAQIERRIILHDNRTIIFHG